MIEVDAIISVARNVMVIKTPKKKKEQKPYITFCIVLGFVDIAPLVIQRHRLGFLAFPHDSRVVNVARG